MFMIPCRRDVEYYEYTVRLGVVRLETKKIRSRRAKVLAQVGMKV